MPNPDEEILISTGKGVIPSLDSILKGDPSEQVSVDTLTAWDTGVFLNELLKQGLVVSATNDEKPQQSLQADGKIQEGTFHGTKLAMVKVYSLVEEAHASDFDSRGLDPIIPLKREVKQKRFIYTWSDPTADALPPHLNTLPKNQTRQDSPNTPNKDSNVGLIFDPGTVQSIGIMTQLFSFIIPAIMSPSGTPFAGPTLADCLAWNKANPSPKTDIMNGENIGNLPDWFSDARYGQQQLSGVNPVTIETVPADKVKTYAAEAAKQGRDDMAKLLSTNQDLYMQDYSYFRAAAKVSDDQEFVNTFNNQTPTLPGLPAPTEQPPMEIGRRYGCASVVLFQLNSDGRLHPLAITLDYKGSLDKSITIYNQRTTPDAKASVAEKDDWPWRYAKTCAQTADWARHQIAVHLVDTHMIEEAIIVATNRTVPENHLLYEILSPHWYRTLALNQAARTIMVPGVITRLAGFGPTPAPPGATPSPYTSKVYDLINWSYENFHFQDKYVPNDLKKRGFDPAELNQPKYRNYAYAHCMLVVWNIIHEFVTAVLQTKYASDAEVAADTFIADWCKEIQTSAKIPTFPTITTIAQLVDAVTMCIHTASPEHTAVNYLQDYYYSFVPAKPPALCAPLPKDLATLQKYTEKDLTAALPIGSTGPVWKDWLLASQLPELLSYKVDTNFTLLTYASSLYNVYKGRAAFEGDKTAAPIKDAAKRMYGQLQRCNDAFKQISDAQTEGTIAYKVLQPETTAVSILI